MATGKALNGKPYVGNPHVRFDEGEVASAATPRRGSLLYKHSIMFAAIAALCAAIAPALSRAATLTHRWSFNGTTDAANLADSVGNATATKYGSGNSWANGKVVMAGGNDRTCGLNLGKNLLDTTAATVEIWGTHKAVMSWSRVFDYACSPTHNGTYAGDYIQWSWTYGTSAERAFAELRRSGAKTTILNSYAGNVRGEPYYFSMTVQKTATGMTIRCMRRNATTGAVEIEGTLAATCSLEDFADPEFLLGESAFADKSASAEYDEVRIWTGILNDEQLTANVLAGPDVVLGGQSDGSGDFEIAAGKSFTVGTSGMFRTAGTVTIGDGAEIVFDTANFMGVEMKFVAGGFVLPSGAASVLDCVRLTDSANFTATLDGNAVTVSCTMPAYARWTAATSPASAADLAVAANWTCYAKDGTTVLSGLVPGAKTTLILDGDVSFSLPAGVAPTWGRTLIGCFTSTQCGRIAAVATPLESAHREKPLCDYTPMGATSLAVLNTNGVNNASGTWVADYLEDSQIRFDGWFFVTASQAGRWDIISRFDDYSSLAIDGEWQFVNARYDPQIGAGCHVTEGWHRFTFVCGDTTGGYGSSALDVDGVKVPFTISINGGTPVAFYNAFSFGAGTGAVRLTANCDWAEMGDLEMSSGATLDLNGHSLVIHDITSFQMGAMVTNSSADASILTYLVDPEASPSKENVIFGGNMTRGKMVEGVATAIWTGSGGDGQPGTSANWICLDSRGATVADGLPGSETTVYVRGNNVNLQVPANASLSCESFRVEVCAFSANCDWRGLSVTPILVGVADLAGRNLTVSDFTLDDTVTAYFTNTSASAVSELHFGSDASMTVDSLAVADCVKIVKDGTGTLTLASLNSSDGIPRIGVTPGVTGVVQQTTGTLAADGLYIGRMSGTIGKYVMDGGTLTTGQNDLLVGGEGGTGEFVQNSGTVTLGNWLVIGRYANGKGIYTIKDGTLTADKQTLYVGWENGATGTFNIEGGNVTLKGLSVAYRDSNDKAGSGKTSSGYVNISGGSLTVPWIDVGHEKNVAARIVQTGGDVTTTTANGNILIGRNAGGTGSYVQSGGTLTMPKGTFGLGYSGANSSGTFTQTGGVVSNNSTSADTYVGQNGKGVMEIGGTYNTSASKGVIVGNAASADGELLLNAGGTLKTSYVRRGNASSANAVEFHGGTLRPTASNATFLQNINRVFYGTGGLTLDTDGKNVTFTGNKTGGAFGSALRKTGEGTLTIDALPLADAVRVEQGTLALSADNTMAARLLHRWSFTGSTAAEQLTDSVGGAVAVTIPATDPALTFDGNTVEMTGAGNSKGSLNLGKGLMTSDAMTIEIWAQRTALKNYSRVFDYGLDTFNYVTFEWCRSTLANTDSFEVRKDGSGSSAGKYPANDKIKFDNTKYHISAKFAPGADGKTLIRYAIRDIATGQVVRGHEYTPNVQWTLHHLKRGTFYLGHSQYSGDHDANAIYDEVRIWHGALTEEALDLSASIGPDATAEQIASIVAKDAEGNANQQTLEIASGATLDLAGHALSQPVVKGAGTITTGAGGAFVVTDRIVATVGECIEASGTINLSNAKIELADPANLATPFTFLKPAAGQTLTVIGVPAPANLPKGWKVSVSANGTCRIVRRGMMLIVR